MTQFLQLFDWLHIRQFWRPAHQIWGGRFDMDNIRVFMILSWNAMENKSSWWTREIFHMQNKVQGKG